jgi:hypothetical protein
MAKELKFSLDDRDKIINHWMLCDNDAAEAIGNTPDWVNNKSLTAKVTVNGVELRFDIVENYFQDVYRSLESEIRENYKDIEAEVQRRLEIRMKEEAQPIIDKLYDLRDVLDSAGNLLKPYWEK